MSKKAKEEVPPPNVVTVTVYECRGCGRRFSTMEDFREHADEMCRPDAFDKAEGLDGKYVRLKDINGFGRVTAVKGCTLGGRFFQIQEEDGRYEVIEASRPMHVDEVEESSKEDVRHTINSFMAHVEEEILRNLASALGKEVGA